MESNQPAQPSIIVAAAPGIQRDALISLLRAQPNLGPPLVVSDAAALRRLTAAKPPHTVVLDASLGANATLELVGWLRLQCPATRCVVLADSAALCTACRKVGADASLLKGCLDQHLLAVLGG